MKKLTYDKIAERWGVSVATAKRRMKAFAGKPCDIGRANALVFAMHEISRIEAAQKKRLAQKLAEAAR